MMTSVSKWKHKKKRDNIAYMCITSCFEIEKDLFWYWLGLIIGSTILFTLNNDQTVEWTRKTNALWTQNIVHIFHHIINLVWFLLSDISYQLNRKAWGNTKRCRSWFTSST